MVGGRVKSIVVTGATGSVGTYVSLFLSRLNIADKLYVASRQEQSLGTVLHNTRACSLFRESKTVVEPLVLDLLDWERTADTLKEVQPSMVVNAATLLSLYPFFPALRKRQHKLGYVPGFAHTLPKDLATLYPLMRAVKAVSPQTLVVNLAAPDTAHAMLAALGLSPQIGAGSIDSSAQGIRLIAARELALSAADVRVQMICHHVVRRMPVGSVPYFIRVMVGDNDVSSQLDLEKMLIEAADITGVETMTTPVLSNAATTAASGVEAAYAVIQDTITERNLAGAEGLAGGGPVALGKGEAKASLPDGITAAKARRINEAGLRATGVESIRPDGSVVFTDQEKRWLSEGLGLTWQDMKLENAYEMSRELESSYRLMTQEELPHG